MAVAKSKPKPCKSRTRARNSSRTVMRTIEKMPQHGNKFQPMYIKCRMWDRIAGRQVIKKVAINVPHEVIHAVVPIGEELTFSHCSAFQSGIAQDLKAWASRVNYERDTPLMGCGLWGDSAPCGKRDSSLYLLTMRFLCGSARQRFWLFASWNRSLCQYGCGGKCTSDDVFKTVAWSFICMLSMS